jgi:hypothetical protein
MNHTDDATVEAQEEFVSRVRADLGEALGVPVDVQVDRVEERSPSVEMALSVRPRAEELSELLNEHQGGYEVESGPGNTLVCRVEVDVDESGDGSTEENDA